MTDAVVNLRCSARGCRRLLISVTEWPGDDSSLWHNASYGVWAEACPKHREVRPNEIISEADERRRSRGLPPLVRGDLMVYVSWSELRRSYLDAISRSRSVDLLKP